MSDDPTGGPGFVLRSDGGSPGELPRIDFSTFVLSLAASALLHLGMAPDPSGEGGSGEVSLPLARPHLVIYQIGEVFGGSHDAHTNVCCTLVKRREKAAPLGRGQFHGRRAPVLNYIPNVLAPASAGAFLMLSGLLIRRAIRLGAFLHCWRESISRLRRHAVSVMETF